MCGRGGGGEMINNLFVCLAGGGGVGVNNLVLLVLP